jgi:hypothetical protein
MVNDLRVDARLARPHFGHLPAATCEDGLPLFTGGQVAARRGVARRRLVAERRVRRLLYRSTHCIVTYSTSSRERKGPARNGLRQLMASVLNSPIVVSVGL